MPAKAQAIDAMAKEITTAGPACSAAAIPVRENRPAPIHRADAEGDEAPGTEGALELVLPPFGIGIQSLEGFRPGEIASEA